MCDWKSDNKTIFSQAHQLLTKVIAFSAVGVLTDGLLLEIGRYCYWNPVGEDTGGTEYDCPYTY